MNKTQVWVSIIAIAALCGALFATVWFLRTRRNTARVNSGTYTMTLERQLVELDRLGLRLDEGITIDDLLYSFPREQYEQKPFDLILFVLGIEVERAPWGRSICSRVWNFDTECIGSSGDYVSVVHRLCEVAGRPGYLSEVSDFVDLESRQGWLKYKVNGAQREHTLEVNDDWADTLVLSYVMDDLQRDGNRFYFKDNGQAMVLFCLDARTAGAINELSGNALKPVLPD